MKKLFGIIAALAFSSVFAQGIVRPPQQDETLLFTRDATLAASTGFSGRVLPRAVKIVRVSGLVLAAGGGGAGNSVVTITDGTNSCTATIACSGTTGTLVVVSATLATGAGTGCNFAAGASVYASVTTAGCTTTQPNLNLNFLGKWQ